MQVVEVVLMALKVLQNPELGKQLQVFELEHTINNPGSCCFGGTQPNYLSSLHCEESGMTASRRVGFPIISLHLNVKVLFTNFLHSYQFNSGMKALMAFKHFRSGKLAA